MSSIVTGILRSTVGLLWNKARDTTAKNLKNGDITDAKIREIVVRELSDIKTKIDGLSRKDLLSSYSFLQEGVHLLNVSLDKSKDDQKAVPNKTQGDDGETSKMPSGSESDILNEALKLSEATGKLKITSHEFESAKERFKDARKEATHAFCNEALNIQDRIFAAKLRVVSEILECLERPETAVTSCLLFLEKLHGLPAVREIFSVYLGGGIKSKFNKAERVENVKSVMMINYVLYQFVSKFSSKCCSALAWPTIQLSDRSFNPIWNWQEVSTRKSWDEELIQPSLIELEFESQILPYSSAVNSRGEIVVIFGNAIEAIYRTGENKVVHEFSVVDQNLQYLALDEGNNVYVLGKRYFNTTSENGNVESLVLYVLDANYNLVKHESKLTFLSKLDLLHLRSVNLAINGNNNIVMITEGINDVYVFDSTGQLKHKFLRKGLLTGPLHLSVSHQNEIMVSSFVAQVIYIYTEEGNLKSTIILPEGHVVRGMASHFLIGKLIVLTYVGKDESYFLHSYSETGELENSVFFGKIPAGGEYPPKITSHPSGPVALVRNRSITYI